MDDNCREKPGNCQLKKTTGCHFRASSRGLKSGIASLQLAAARHSLQVSQVTTSRFRTFSAELFFHHLCPVGALRTAPPTHRFVAGKVRRHRRARNSCRCISESPGRVDRWQYNDRSMFSSVAGMWTATTRSSIRPKRRCRMALRVTGVTKSSPSQEKFRFPIQSYTLKKQSAALCFKRVESLCCRPNGHLRRAPWRKSKVLDLHGIRKPDAHSV